MGNNAVDLTELLNNLDTAVSFRPEGGAFRSKLAEIVVADADADFAELFSESSSDILISISARTVEEGVVRFLVSSDQGENSLDCPLAALNSDEISDFGEQLSRLVAEQHSSSAKFSPKVVVRKKLVEGMLSIQQAAQGLGCSESFLKSRIPCSDYSYDEVDGKTEIKGYFWSNQLIDRLCQIKSDGMKPEDVEYVAVECCHGDSIWAQEILTSLARPVPKSRDGTLPKVASKQPEKTISKIHANNRRPRKKKGPGSDKTQG